MILVKCQRSFKISFFDPNYAFPGPQAPTPPYNAHAHRQDLYLYPILWSICFELISGEHDVLIIWIYPIENIPKSCKTTKGRHLQTRADVSQPKIATASKWNMTL